MATAAIAYELTARDYVAVLVRRKVVFSTAAVSIVLIAVLTSLLLPSIYRSTATILIEQQEIPPELVRSTVTSYADQRIQTINQRVMTGENLLGIVEKFDLYPDERRRLAREQLLEQVRDNISLEIVSAEVIDPRRGVPMNATIAFTVGFEDSDPDKAYRVANELTSLYLSENLQTRTDLARDATAFLREEGDRLSQDVAELETKLAAFKREHVNALPELFQVNVQQFERAERDLEDAERALRANEDRKVYLESELALQSPFQSLMSENGERLLSPSDRLQSLQAQLASMVGVYSEEHPDIKRIRESIAGLETEVDDVQQRRDLAARLDATKAELAAISSRYSDEHPAVIALRSQVNTLIAMMDESVNDSRVSAAPTNPAYVQLKAQLDTVKLENASLIQRKADIERRLIEVESRLQRTPQIEKEYRDLAGNLQNAQSKYLEVRNKAMEARLGESLEADRKGERFTLIDPARVPEKPVSPHRGVIIGLGIVLALLAGFAAVAAYEALDERVFGPQMVAALLGAPPLGIVPVIVTSDEQRDVMRLRWSMASATALVLVLGAIAIHVFVIPLDTAVFALMRRYGL